MLETELKGIYEVCLLQRGLNMDWFQLKKFIKRDIQEYSQKIDCNVEECSILNVRKWMELWASIDEYKILNIMRWFWGIRRKASPSGLLKQYDWTGLHMLSTAKAFSFRCQYT